MAHLKVQKENVKWWVLFATICSTALVFYDMTGLPVALPTIQRDFLCTDTQLKWLINAYVLSMALLVATSGKLSDHIGQRVVLKLGFGLFTLASAFCALSPSTGYLLLGRAVQGVSAALLFPVALAVLIQTFPPEKKGFALGINVCFGAIFITLGPFVGGLFTEYLSWRYIFWVNLPIAILGFVLTQIFIPKSRHKASSFDFVGWIVFLVGFGSLIFAIMQGSEWGWSSIPIIVLFCFGGLFLTALVFIEKRIQVPFLDFSLFKNPVFSACCISTFFTQVLLLATVYWVIFFQQSLGFSINQAGSLIMLANAPVLIGGPLSGFLLDRYGLKAALFFGNLLSIFCYIWMAFIPGDAGVLWLLPSLITWGIGIPLILSPSMAEGISAAVQSKQGAASGVLNTFRSCGAATGVAVLGSIFIDVQHSKFQSLLDSTPSTSHLRASVFEGLLSKTSSAVQALSSLPSSVAAQVQTFLMDSSGDGFFVMNLTAGLAEFVVAVIALILIRKTFRKKDQKSS